MKTPGRAPDSQRIARSSLSPSSASALVRHVQCRVTHWQMTRSTGRITDMMPVTQINDSGRTRRTSMKIRVTRSLSPPTRAPEDPESAPGGPSPEGADRDCHQLRPVRAPGHPAGPASFALFRVGPGSLRPWNPAHTALPQSQSRCHCQWQWQSPALQVGTL